MSAARVTAGAEAAAPSWGSWELSLCSLTSSFFSPLLGPGSPSPKLPFCQILTFTWALRQIEAPCGWECGLGPGFQLLLFLY